MTANPRLQPIVQAALRWHKQGATVLRCEGKAPLDKSWTTLDPEELLRRFVEEPSSQIGLRMGLQRSGKLLLAIDVDGATGRASLEALEDELGHLPESFSQRTGGGGLHHVFVWPAARASECPTVSKGKLAPGLDVRARGGQIIGAPSPHESGTPYAIMEGRALAEVGIVELPEAWVDRVVETHAPAAPAREMHSRANDDAAPRDTSAVLARACAYVSKMPPSISGSGGHDACWLAAQVAARGFALGFNDTMRVLLEFNARCEPPWSRRELEHKAEQAIAKSRMPLGLLLQSDDTSAAHDHDAWISDWDDHSAAPTGADLEREAIEQECETVQDAVAAVAQRPAASQGLKPGAVKRQPERFAFPGQHGSDGETAPAPQASVPEPERWVEDDDTMPDPPSLPRVPSGTFDRVNVKSIADHLLGCVDRMFPSGGFVEDGGRFYVYREGIFEKLPRYWVKSAAAQYDTPNLRTPKGDCFNANLTNLNSVEALVTLALQTRQSSHSDRSFFDGSPALAVFSNCALVIGDDGKPTVTEHSQRHRARFRYPFDYDPGLAPENFIKVARDWFRAVDEQEANARILAVRQYFGHVLLGSLWRLKLSKALLFLGEGHDGKNTAINLLRACLPKGSTSELDPSSLMSKSNTSDLTMAALHGKLVNICDDISGEEWPNTAPLKRLVDHAHVSARRIGKDPFEFRCMAAHVYAGNALPKVYDKSHGFFRRWVLIHFPSSIPYHLRDPLLEQKILSLEKRELVCWLVDAALDMLRGDASRELAEPSCNQELLGQWAIGDDSVASFVEGWTEDAGTDKDSWTPFAELYAAYAHWCRDMYGEFRAAREAKDKVTFSRVVPKLRGVKKATRGKANTVVVNRRIRKSEDS